MQGSWLDISGRCKQEGQCDLEMSWTVPCLAPMKAFSTCTNAFIFSHQIDIHRIYDLELQVLQAAAAAMKAPVIMGCSVNFVSLK